MMPTLTIRYNGVNYRADADTRQECADRVADMMVNDGFTFPKPWEFWRWGEAGPSPIMRASLAKRLGVSP
jgi:hypothetical protein